MPRQKSPHSAKSGFLVPRWPKVRPAAVRPVFGPFWLCQLSNGAAVVKVPCGEAQGTLAAGVAVLDQSAPRLDLGADASPERARSPFGRSFWPEGPCACAVCFPHTARAPTHIPLVERMQLVIPDRRAKPRARVRLPPGSVSYCCDGCWLAGVLRCTGPQVPVRYIARRSVLVVRTACFPASVHRERRGLASQIGRCRRLCA